MEDKTHLTCDLISKGEQHGCHVGGNCGMAVVAAGVHHPGYLRAILQPRGLLYWQSIHVGPYENGFTRSRTPKPCHHASLCYPSSNLEAQPLQKISQLCAGLHLLKSKLGMAVEVPAHLEQAGGDFSDGFSKIHAIQSSIIRTTRQQYKAVAKTTGPNPTTPRPKRPRTIVHGLRISYPEQSLAGTAFFS